MGVRGLKMFLENEQPSYRINIGDEIAKWKRFNHDHKPTIVIDFMSLSHPIAMRNMHDIICGGRSQKVLDEWKNMLKVLKSFECELVFFNDLNIPVGKIHEFLSRRNEDFKIYTKLYDLIDDGKNDLGMLVKQMSKKPLTSIFHGMASVAQSYGELYESTEHEADFEIAQYAKRNNAMAIVSDDTDFLIFDGLWRLWSARDISISRSYQALTTECDPDDLKYFLSLESEQLPLFATLSGNDITQALSVELNNFFGAKKNKIRNVAQFVRDMGPKYDIHQIVLEIFGKIDNYIVELIESSIDSYNTDVETTDINSDPIAKLMNFKLYRSYKKILASVQSRGMTFYDLRGCAPGISLPDLLTDWIKRKKGIIINDSEVGSNTFTLIVTKDINAGCMAYTETSTYPDFQVPPLDELYSKSNDIDINEIRWKIFGSIMSFDGVTVAVIQQLPKKFLLISTTLYALVKHRLISTKSADGILYTEFRISKNKTAIISYPTSLVTEYVRAAHIYNIAFSAVRENFTIAGLLPAIEDVMQFDGVYFQRLMQRMTKWSDMDREVLFEPIQTYRIYV